jgi:branched-chain amino acid transport system permease protein
MKRTILIGLIVMGGLLLFPAFYYSKFLIDYITQILISALFAGSLNLLVGYTGMVSFGHAAFFGVGAYGVGVLLQKYSFGLLGSMILAIGMAAVVAMIIGFFCIRLNEIYFAMLTMAFAQIVYTVVVKWTPVTGGDQGLIGGIPKPPISLGFFSLDIGDPLNFYFFTVFWVIGSFILLQIIVDSPFGTILKTIRDNALRSFFIGIPVKRFQWIVFVIAGTFAGISGALMALFISGAYPDFTYWTKSAEPIFMILVGGMGSLLGPILGAVVFNLLNAYITVYTQLYELVMGVILVMIILSLKRGLGDFLLEREWWKRPWASGREQEGGKS